MFDLPFRLVPNLISAAFWWARTCVHCLRLCFLREPGAAVAAGGAGAEAHGGSGGGGAERGAAADHQGEDQGAFVRPEQLGGFQPLKGP